MPSISGAMRSAVALLALLCSLPHSNLAQEGPLVRTVAVSKPFTVGVKSSTMQYQVIRTGTKSIRYRGARPFRISRRRGYRVRSPGTAPIVQQVVQHVDPPAVAEVQPDHSGGPKMNEKTSRPHLGLWWADQVPAKLMAMDNPSGWHPHAHPGVPLTEMGKRTKRVIVVSLVGGVCRSDDWRGELPKHIMQFLPHARAVLLFANNPEAWKCCECRPTGVAMASTACENLMGRRREKKPADMVLVIGSGDQDFNATGRGAWPALRALFRSGYIADHTTTVHIPIRKSKNLGFFPFKYIINDSDFVKPLSTSSLQEMKQLCAAQEKTNSLIYVGRYQESKGQEEFLATVDPRDLEGYHINFFGSDYGNRNYVGRLEQLIAERNISATVHPSVRKEYLLRNYCESVGQIHYASGDNNPRAVYEGLYGGSPQFISYETRVHESLYEQSFVTGIEFGNTAAFSSHFKAFMEQVRNPDRVQQDIQRFVNSNLVPQNVYRRICATIGLCQPVQAAGANSTDTPAAPAISQEDLSMLRAMSQDML